MEQGTKFGGRLKRSVIATIQSAGAPSASDGDKLDDGFDDWLIIYNINDHNNINYDKEMKIFSYGWTIFCHYTITVSGQFNIFVINLRF